MPGIWISPATWTAGQVVDENDLNTQLRNQLNALKNDHWLAGGRITLVSSVPVPTGDVSTPVTTIYYTPYKGNMIGLYTDSLWHVRQFAELSLALGTDGLTGEPIFDLFAYFNTSTGLVALERTVWSTPTTRVTGLSWLDGVLVKAGDSTRRYLGTYRLNSTGNIVDTASKRYVWNYDNRVRRELRYIHPTTSWTYTLAVLRAAQGATDSRIDIVVGYPEVTVDLTLLAQGSNTGPVTLQVGIGENSTTAAVAECIYTQSGVDTNRPANPSARLSKLAPIGVTSYYWLELSEAVGTTTWLGLFTGLSGSLEG